MLNLKLEYVYDKKWCSEILHHLTETKSIIKCINLILMKH